MTTHTENGLPRPIDAENEQPDDQPPSLQEDSHPDHQSRAETIQPKTTTRGNGYPRPLPTQYAVTVLTRFKLADEVSARAPGLNATGALKLVDIVLGEIAAGLRRDGDVLVPGLGRFRAVRRAARKGVNPRTGERINIPPKSVVTFKAAARFLNRIFDDE